MIWIHEYRNEQEVLEGVTQQLFKHIQTTRFIPPCPRTPSGRRAANDEEERTYPTLKETFFLAIPGDRFGPKILNFWTENHSENPIWQKVAFYQTHERHLSPKTHSQVSLWSEHPFFKKAGIESSRIHPIEQVGNIDKNALIYTLRLPHSQGLYYNPAQAYEGNYATTMYESPFHCAIVFLTRQGDICYTHHSRAPFYGCTYYTTEIDLMGDGTTISVEALLDTPRLLLIMLDEDFHFILGRSPLSLILQNHPNIHIFSDIRNFAPIVKEKGLDSLWFYERPVAP